MMAEQSENVSRRRYNRERVARQEAETLLDERSRALWEANQQLIAQADLLERKVEERTAELRSAMQAAEASNAAKSIFLASMSHEIRTPLNGVLGMAQALMDTKLNSEQIEMVATVIDSGHILLSVLNDILDISKIEAGQLEIEYIPFDVDALFQATKQLYEFKAKEKGIEFNVSVSDAAKCWLSGDPVRLRQVAGNLISNAIKFTEKGSVSCDVDLRQKSGKSVLSIAISDTGEGISPDKMDMLFKPFQQLNSSDNRKHGGTGLGLSISRQICRLMDGDISIQSEFGKGSTFRAYVTVEETAPVVKEAAIDLGDALEVLNSRKWKVLLAEDSKTNQMVFTKFVKAMDLDLTIAGDGAIAVEAYRSGAFDLVLMDINMPNMDGVEATKAIRAFEAGQGNAKTPIIALTANSMVHQIDGYLEAGMDAHLAKPLKKEVLLRRMSEMLSRPDAKPDGQT